GDDIGGFREQQDALLQSLMQHWGTLEHPPQDFSPTGVWTESDRNDILLRTQRTEVKEERDHGRLASDDIPWRRGAREHHKAGARGGEGRDGVGPSENGGGTGRD